MVLLLLPRLTRHEQNDLFCWSQPDLSRNDDDDVVALKEEQLVGGDSDDKTLSFPTNTAATGETGKSLRGNAISSLLGPASTNIESVFVCVCVCVMCVYCVEVEASRCSGEAESRERSIYPSISHSHFVSELSSYSNYLPLSPVKC
jgi:hypothetical protein